MKTKDMGGVWKSRLSDLLLAKGQMLGKGRALTPEELSKEIGVSRQTVYNWMSPDGLKTLTANHAIRLERFFGVPVERIWQLEEDEPGNVTALATA